MISNKLLAASASSTTTLDVEDVFSTYLYEGTGVSNTITNGIDLAGEGGMVWTKSRSQGTTGYTGYNHLYDTERGISFAIFSDGAFTNQTRPIVSFNSDGFTLPVDTGWGINYNTHDFVSWTFRKAPKFFDVITYTGTGGVRNIAHELGIAPGMILVKWTGGTTNWQVYHRGSTATDSLQLNLNNASFVDTGGAYWDNTEPTDAVFTVGDSNNTSGRDFVAYVFAHDDSAEGMIQCGGFTTDGSGSASVNLGWEPQYLMFKNSSGTQDWVVVDSMRAMSVSSSGGGLFPNTTAAESAVTPRIEPTATGFEVLFQPASSTYIYMAIRRPMRTPTAGTEVFAIDTWGSTGDGDLPSFRAPFPVDMATLQWSGSNTTSLGARLIQGRELVTGTSAGDIANTRFVWDFMNGWYDQPGTQTTWSSYMFKRAPGFFDVICYEGTGVAHTEAHNLGAVPELIITKGRDSPWTWVVYSDALAANDVLQLQVNSAPVSISTAFDATAATDSVVNFGTYAGVNYNGDSFMSFLFSTLPGISKVGSYTGNGSSQTIDCAFTTGARFILIKRTDSTGDWYVWDSLRGIVAGNDPHHSLNGTNATITTDDSVDPDSSGFIVNQVAATNVNVTSATYLFLAIA